MNPIAEEMMSFYSGDESEEREDKLEHYGMPKRSGRYPYGSGDDPYQRNGRDFLGRVEEMRKSGFTFTDEDGKTWTGDTAIAKSMGISSTNFRTEIGLAKDERRMIATARAQSLQKDGLGNTEIGRQMGLPESTVRSLLNADAEARMNQARETANIIKQQVDSKGMIDVGTGVERELGVSKEKLNQALYLLEREGYPIYKGGIPQVTNKGQQTNQKVICPPGTEHKEIYNYDKINTLKEYVSQDGGDTFRKKFTYPESLDSKRLQIRYNEEGGLEMDGVIQLRRGVEDLDLGGSRYSQVRIMVDGTHYLKGMAVYADDLPPGVDVRFNTNKMKGTPMEKVLKEIKEDSDNPFGSAIKDAEQGGQYWYTDKNGKQKLGLINKRSDEGDWTEWKDALPSQFLSKQSLFLAKKQLGLALTDKTDEFNDLKSLENPTLKKHLLSKFADECDSAAIHLQASALPGQKYHVILPVNDLKDTEVYAPRYENGTQLALIRYPHGGTFEIPIVTVNNRNKTAQKMLGNDVGDAIGINSKVAERLSGADFDGDTVMTIPTHDAKGKVKITSTPPLKGLEGFDPKMEYPERPGMKVMNNTGTQMGVISNLITDMTLKGATQDELARAVRHSMVVIDAQKHHLDYKKSEIDNGIAALKRTYQSYVGADGKVHVGGASTLLSKSKGEIPVPKRQGSPIIDPTTGKVSYKTADDLEYTVRKINKKTGEVTEIVKQRTQKSTKMAETDDATTLISKENTPMERAYADYANRMKSLANQARMEMMATGKIAYSAAAKKKYAPEVKSLEAKLNEAELNRPRERQAQLKANAEVRSKLTANPNLKPDEIKKISQQALSKYRTEVGSVSRRDRSIKIDDNEWRAIQEGAISENQLKKILNNTDIDSLRQRATPRTTTSLSTSKVSRIKALSSSNYTIAEIAAKLGVSASVVSKYLKGGN